MENCNKLVVDIAVVALDVVTGIILFDVDLHCFLRISYLTFRQFPNLILMDVLLIIPDLDVKQRHMCQKLEKSLTTATTRRTTTAATACVKNLLIR